MFDRVLKRMRELVRTRQYVVTLHADEEMVADDLTIYDVESAILTGRIVECQKDRASGERKYCCEWPVTCRRTGYGRGQSESHRQSGVHYRLSRIGWKIMARTVPLVCDICGESGAQVRHISRTYGKGANLFVIENVPIVSCPHCGESYLTAETLHEIERLKLHRRSLAKERRVAVATFA